MSEDANKTTAADDALSQAAADAVAGQVDGDQTVTEETVAGETETEEVIAEEVIETELPEDHDDRSQLGRKISAYHKRQDDFEDRLDRVLSLIEKQELAKQTQEQELYDPDEPLTRAQAKEFWDAREKQKVQIATQAKEEYNTNYLSTLGKLTQTLDESEADGILLELQGLRYDPSDDPVSDATNNLYKAHVAYLKKGKTTKEIPLKGTDKNLGVVTTQKTITKDAALPKLDAAGQSYLAFVAREDGAEKATKLHKNLNKE